MPPVQLALRGFAIVGTTQLIWALTIFLYLLSRQNKSRATWLLCLFFGGVTVGGVATLFANGLLFWDEIFTPWQDAFVIFGGVALAQFAYYFPRPDNLREARIVLFISLVLAVLAFAYSVWYAYTFTFQWAPGMSVSDAFYTLLPLSTLFVVFVFLRRAVYFSSRAGAATRSFLYQLVHPQSRDAEAMRSFGLALSLGFLPGLSVLFTFPAPFGFFALNIGTLLALGAVALVYLNHTGEMASFMAKLVGITLVTVLLIISLIGTSVFQQQEADYDTNILQSLMTTHAMLQHDDAGIPAVPIAYVTAWDADAPANPKEFRALYLQPAAGLELNSLLAPHGPAAIPAGPGYLGTLLAQRTNEIWQRVERYGTFPTRSGVPDFVGFVFMQDKTAYEIGLAQAEQIAYFNNIILRWILLIIVSSVFILAVYPVFFRRMLIEPLRNLLDGVSRVKQGALDTTVQITYPDEIGSLTESFNTLTYSLKESYESLEQRVADRTRELAAFADLTMLSSQDVDLAEMLQPVLDRILDAVPCRAIVLHILQEDSRALLLLAQRYVPQAALDELQNIPLSKAFATRITDTGAPLITGHLSTQPELPDALKRVPYETYLGSALNAGGHSQGWLSCYREAGKEFSVSEASFLVALARHLDVIVENHRLRRRIGQVAVYDERQRLARDLHDSVTQLLYSLTLFAHTGREASADGDTQRLQHSLEQIEIIAQRALRGMRSLLYELQPPHLRQKGLVQVLHERFDQVERRVGVQVDFQADETLRIPYQIQKELYFIGIEALNNSLKHAHALHVTVSLAQSHDALVMSIADDGSGFDTQHVLPGSGLQNMRSRVAQLGGTFSLESVEASGTRIRVVVPLEQ